MYSKTAIMEEDKKARLRFAKNIIADGWTEGLIFRHCIWIDLCSSILPGSQKKAEQQILARKGKRRWHSQGAKEYSRNLQAPATAEKQCGWGDVRFWWCPVLARGKLHVEVFGTDFPGECAAGVALLVGRIPGILARRFPEAAQKPKMLFPDKGRGFWAPHGGMTLKFAEAMDRTGLRAFVGDSARDMPRDMPDLLLHETAVRWIRVRVSLTTPRHPWLETKEEYGARLRAAAQEVTLVSLSMGGVRVRALYKTRVLVHRIKNVGEQDVRRGRLVPRVHQTLPRRHREGRRQTGEP